MDERSRDSADHVDPTQVTQLLAAVNRGEEDAWDKLLPVIQEELQMLARSRLSGGMQNWTLQATALVNEAVIKLIGVELSNWENRAHFFSAAALAMRNIMVDAARRRGSQKRGGDHKRIPLQEDLVTSNEVADIDILALDEALEELESLDSLQYQIVMLRYFSGLSIPEVAETLEISSSSVDRHWSFARVWLQRKIS